MNSQTPSSRQKGSAPSEVMTATYQPLDQTDGSGRSTVSPEWRHAGDPQRIRDWLGGGFMWFPISFHFTPISGKTIQFDLRILLKWVETAT